MGVYIPNMEKPKSCWECRLMDGEANCLVTDEGIPFEQEGILPDCPLIEIVRCGECKHCKKRETAKHILINYCEAHGISVLDTDYCNWGERRAYEHTD